MITFKEFTENYEYVALAYFRFESQTDVRYSIPYYNISVHLSKADLIVCINHFLNRLSKYDFYSRIKKGFVLEKFKYYELSVYLHGILQLYAANIGLSPVGELYITRFSHLPHDILKAEKVKKDFVVTLVDDFYNGRYYVCVINGVPVCSHSLVMLQAHIFLHFPSLRDYDLTFIVK